MNYTISLHLRIFMTLVFCLTLGSGFSQNYKGSKRKIDKILKNIEQFSASVVSRDYMAIGKAYTDDAKIFPSRLPILEGTRAITDYWNPNGDGRTTYHKVSPIEIVVKGKVAYDHGRYEGSTQKKNGEQVDWQGKYVIVWKKVKKEWKIYLDIWNRTVN